METISTPGGREFAEFDLKHYLAGGILRETPFREAMDSVAWSDFDGHDVLVRACHTAPLPPWAFMLVASRLVKYAASVWYGEPGDPVPVYEREIG